MKTKGQILYEHKSPTHFEVVRWDQRHFATYDDVLLMCNEHHVPWDFLTEKSRQGWEETAIGHSLFSEEPR